MHTEMRQLSVELHLGDKVKLHRAVQPDYVPQPKGEGDILFFGADAVGVGVGVTFLHDIS